MRTPRYTQPEADMPLYNIPMEHIEQQALALHAEQQGRHIAFLTGCLVGLGIAVNRQQTREEEESA